MPIRAGERHRYPADRGHHAATRAAARRQAAHDAGQLALALDEAVA